MKKKTIVLLAVLGVVVIAAAVIVSGVLNPNVYLRITNQSDGELYNYWMYYSYQGKIGREAEMAKGLSKPSSAPGDNSRKPFVVGESVKTKMPPNEIQDVPVSDKLTIELHVHDRPILTAEDQAFEKGVSAGAITIPAKAGKCSELVITGNREDGFNLEFTGFSNWLIH
jgi:hypothetical protein